MQRDREFRNYEDSEARYELRPSAWVEPTGTWAPGRVELMQLNTPDETNDNIVAYWVPREAPAPGQPLDFTYRLHWQGMQQEQHPPGAWVAADARRPRLRRARRRRAAICRRLHRPIARRAAADATVKAVVTAPANGQVVESNAYRVEATGAWRMTVRVKQLNRNEPTELRGFLQSGNDVLTETWSNILPPLLQR